MSVVIAALAGLARHATKACLAGEAQATVRFNVASDRLYLEGAGCITPSMIYAEKLASDTSIPIKAVTAAGASSVNETG